MADSGQRQLRSESAEKKNMDQLSAAVWLKAREEEADAAAAKAYSRPPGMVEDMFVKPEDVAAARSAIDEADEERHHKKKGVGGKVKEKLGSVKDTVIGHHDHVTEGRNPSSKVGCVDTVKNLVSGPKPKEDNYEETEVMVSAPLGSPGVTLDSPRERGFVDTLSTDTEGAVHGGRRVGGERLESN